MTAEDRLRDRLRSVGASMPLGTGSLTGVQARAARLQRRRTAARAGAGALALVAVVAVGLTTLRDGGIDEFSDSVATESQADAATPAGDAVNGLPEPVDVGAAAEKDPRLEAEMSEEEFLDEPVAAAADEFVDDLADSAMSDESDMSDESGESDKSAVPAESDMLGASDDAELPGGSDASGVGRQGVVFARTVSVVKPPVAVPAAVMRYSFSGSHALARTADDWYAYDGADWQSLGLPDDMEVVAVDLSDTGRLAVFGVVQPLECARAQVVAVRTDETWSYVRVDDGTPSSVGWELLEARIRVTDAAIELERAERLWLDDECEAASDAEPLTDEAADLLSDLGRLDEVWRDSWPHAPLQGGLAHLWQEEAHADAHAAAASGAGLVWADMSPPRYRVPLRVMTPSRAADGSAAVVALHETTVMDVATSMHVSDGKAMLRHGEQSWEVCPVSDEDLHQVNGEVGRAGEHLAVVVGKPNQTLFVIERTE